MHTPWGPSQTVYTLGEIGVEVSTAGHGGIRLNPKYRDKVPAQWRSDDGWYEEDVQWANAVICIPELAVQMAISRLPDGTHEERLAKAEKTMAAAESTVMSWEPDLYEHLRGVKVTAEQSHVVREREFYAKHKNDWVCISAVGPVSYKPHIPEGMVEVTAILGGHGPIGSDGRRTSEHRYFMVPAEEYRAQRLASGCSFVIDLERHKEWTNLPVEV